MNTTHQIITGDSRCMQAVASGSVQLVVTSPPYWQLKDYGSKNQIGYNQSYEDYINNLNLVWAQCHRVLENGCRLCVNIGDQFARAAYYGRYKVIPIKSEIIKFCEAVGFDYMGTIIWQKTTTSNASGGGAVMGSFPYPRNGIIKLDYESILVFKKLGKPSKRAVSPAIKKQSQLTNKEWNTYFSGHWNFAGARQDKHIAMFPPELPKRLIKMFSFVGDTVLDPFLGSGTTAATAMTLNRNSIGYEINPDFRAIIEEKLNEGNDLLQPATLEFLKEQVLSAQSHKESIAQLPYVFTDMVKIKRKANPKHFSFGSKIDGQGGGQKDTALLRVQSVTSPTTLLLSNDTSIRLLGVKPIAAHKAKVVAFIEAKTKGQQVRIQPDGNRYDEEGNLYCYLYLANKTFINAHLIKSGFASVDKSVSHKHLARFIKYQEESNRG